MNTKSQQQISDAELASARKQESNALLFLVLAFLLGVISASCTKSPSQLNKERMSRSDINVRAVDQQYQIQLTNDSIYILDGSFLVGVMPLDNNTELGKMLLYDNQ